MSVQIDVVEYKDGEPVKHVGEFDFFTAPETGDRIELGTGSVIKEYKVLFRLHAANTTEAVKAAPNSLGAEDRKPNLAVEFLRDVYSDYPFFAEDL